MHTALKLVLFPLHADTGIFCECILVYSAVHGLSILLKKSSKLFTSLDLKSGYWQVLKDENDKEETAFCTHRGLFEFNKMPFGLSNAPVLKFNHNDCDYEDKMKNKHVKSVLKQFINFI